VAKRINGIKIECAVNDNESMYLEDVMEAVEIAVTGIAHDACAELLMDVQHCWDEEEYDALLVRVRKAALKRVADVIHAAR
jgi:hypothetical protein